MMNAATLVALAKTRGVRLATAESCTGGMIAAALTDIAGSSAVFTHGFVTYSNEAKSEMLGVPEGLINAVGAVSEAVARRMAMGARLRAGADFALSVTGIAGPDGGSPAKPTGTVWFGLAGPDIIITRHRVFSGDRAQVRAQAVTCALELFGEAIK